MNTENLEAWAKKNWQWLAIGAALLLGIILYVRVKSAGTSQQQTAGTGGLTGAQAAQLAAQQQQGDTALAAAQLQADTQQQTATLQAQLGEDTLKAQAAQAAINTQAGVQIATLTAQTQQQANALAAGVANAGVANQGAAIAAASANQNRASTLNFLGQSVIPVLQRLFPNTSNGFGGTGGGSFGGNQSNGGLNNGVPAEAAPMTPPPTITPTDIAAPALDIITPPPFDFAAPLAA